MIELRPYQQRLVDKTRRALMKERRVILCAPTGSGKTVTFSYIASNSVNKGNKVLIVTSRAEILKQNARAMRWSGFNPEYVSASKKHIPEGSLIIAMAQTLQRRVDKEDWREWLKTINLVIIDECHENHTNFIFEYLSESCFVIGATATPKRYSSQKQLGDFYRDIVEEVSVKDLIGLGNLVKGKGYTFSAPALSDIGFDSNTGDFVQSQLASKFESKVYYTGVVSNYLRICPHTKAVCFCVSAKQAIETTREFLANGVKAKYLLSGVFDSDEELSGERKQVLEEFENGEIEVLVNVGILVAGFDCPSVETIILSFATMSLTKYLQALGRGSRPCLGKTHFNYLDFGDNVRRHGLYEDDRKWSLWHERKIGGGIPILKECPECFRFLPNTRMVCPYCGHVFPTERQEYEIELQEVVGDEQDESRMTVAQYAAHKALAGWDAMRILTDVMKRNKYEQRRAFDEAREVLKTMNGKEISPQLYFVIKKFKLNYRGKFAR